MPEKPKPSADDLVRTLFQLEATMTDAQMQQMLNRLGQQTFVGGKRVAIEKLPRLPNAWGRRTDGNPVTARMNVTTKYIVSRTLKDAYA